MESLNLGKFRLVAHLGRGGMADVFLAATDELAVDFTKLVVIKKLREEHAQDGEFVTMFLDEARIAARLNHPNVIQTLEVGQIDEEFYLSMEYLDGQPFSRLITTSAFGLPLGMHLTIISEALGGLHYAHELKDYDGTPLHMVHRDVTPHNIFVTYTGQVKVMDFGIAKAAGRLAETRFGVIKGKVGYMAPEQVALKPVDRRGDVFAVGVAVFEAATRSRMWGRTPHAEVLKRLARGEHPTSPRAKRADVHEELDRICMKALAPDPNDRYSTALAFQEELDAFISEHERRPSPRQLGTFVSNLFAEQQERARAIIQEQLKGLVNSRRTVVAIDVPLDEPSDTDQQPFSEDSVPRSLTPSATIHSHHPGPVQTKLSPVPGAPRPGPSRTLVVLGALAAVALLLIGVGLSGALGPSTHAPPPPAEMTLILRATPLEVHFTIDDGAKVENPYVVHMPVDSKPHVVRAEAPGYATETEEVRFERDLSLRFSLARAGADSVSDARGRAE